MKFSLNTIQNMNRQYDCSADIVAVGLDALEYKIGTQLGAIEETVHLGDAYKGIIIVRVVSVADHPDADRLHICKIDDAGKVASVERDEKGFVQVVCGAPNVHRNMLAAWLPPESTVPESFWKEPFVLSTREIRGQKSNGMLASPKELGLGDNHSGILEIDGDHTPGTDFAEAFGLKDDIVIDIENKMFTHRPDCFGFLGIARELSGIQNLSFKSPDWYVTDPFFPAMESDQLSLTFSNELPGLVPRFTLVPLTDVAVGPSPVWLQVELAKVGIRSINNIVDYTNYFMIETAQPLHAYDYDKVKALSVDDKATIVVRNPKPEEKITLLNGKTIQPRPDAIMIATDKQLIGVGGIMGGADTEVDDSTKNIILECGTFDMYSVRRTAMEHGLFTDALTRFNKGQSPLQNRTVLAKITSEIKKSPGGKVAGPIVDDNHLDQVIQARQSIYPIVRVAADFINDRLGLSLAAIEMKRILENVEFKVDIDRSDLIVHAPFWRTDIELREDIVEEVGRLYGYDKLPLVLPKRYIEPAHRNALFDFKDTLRDFLSRAGANELLTYSFIHGDLLDKVGQDRNVAFQVSNALSPGLQYYRLSLLPSLLEKVHPNIKAGYNELAIFELGKTHETSAIDESGLPFEFEKLAFIYANHDSIKGAPYYMARTYLNYLLSKIGVAYSLKPFENSIGQADIPFLPKRSAVIYGSDKNDALGVIGEIKPAIRKALKLPTSTAAFEIDIVKLLRQVSPSKPYSPLSRYPKVEQDLSLKVTFELPFQDLLDFLEQEIKELMPPYSSIHLSAIDMFQREDDKNHKQLLFRLSIANYDKTLTDKDVNELLNRVAESAKNKYGAERI